MVVRVDRLVAVLLLLQARGQVTAAEVADELEVSERTARRDLDSLVTAGLPIYSVRGRGGGWRLLGDGRTDLSGLTLDEARALVLAVGTAADVGGSVRAGLRKLQHALPGPVRASAEVAAAVTIVDQDGWERVTSRRSAPPPAMLDDVHRATVSGERVVIGYVNRDRTPSEREVDPHAVVNHGGTWYLLAVTDEGERTFRIDRIVSVEPTGRAGERPADYDAALAWREAAQRIDVLRAPVTAELLVQERSVTGVRWIAGRRLTHVGDADPDGWVPCTMRGQRSAAIARELAGMGAAVRVLGPPDVVAELRRLATELLETYPSA